MSISEVLTLLLVVFAALSYIDNHNKKIASHVQMRCYFSFSCEAIKLTESKSEITSN